MTSRFVRVSISCLLLLAMASPSFAARRSSLAGNLLIRDTDDIFFFPQLVSQHKRHVTFDIGPSSGLGSGGLIFGNENLTLGAFAHRSDFLGAIPNAFFTRGDIDNIAQAGTTNRNTGVPFPGFGPSDGALNFVDVLFGAQMGDTPWGLRVSLGRNQQDDPDDLDPPDQGPATVTTFNGVVGITLPTWATDLSGEIAIGSASTEVVAGTKSESTPVMFSLAARKTASEDSDALTLGWLGMFNYFTAGVDNTVAGVKTTTDDSGFNFQAGLGPVYRPNDRTSVAMYGTFDFQTEKTDDGTTETTVRTIGVPGWNIAAEVELASWLQFRAGLRSRFGFDKTTVKAATPPPPEQKDGDNSLDFVWTSGVGVHIDNFHFDGYFDPSVLTNGTSLLGTANNRLFGLVTASLDF